MTNDAHILKIRRKLNELKAIQVHRIEQKQSDLSPNDILALTISEAEYLMGVITARDMEIEQLKNR